jgi:hypothetical protein
MVFKVVPLFPHSSEQWGEQSYLARFHCRKTSIRSSMNRRPKMDQVQKRYWWKRKIKNSSKTCEGMYKVLLLLLLLLRPLLLLLLLLLILILLLLLLLRLLPLIIIIRTIPATQTLNALCCCIQPCDLFFTQHIHI